MEGNKLVFKVREPEPEYMGDATIDRKFVEAVYMLHAMHLRKPWKPAVIHVDLDTMDFNAQMAAKTRLDALLDETAETNDLVSTCVAEGWNTIQLIYNPNVE